MFCLALIVRITQGNTAVSVSPFSKEEVEGSLKNAESSLFILTASKLSSRKRSTQSGLQASCSTGCELNPFPLLDIGST